MHYTLKYSINTGLWKLNDEEYCDETLALQIGIFDCCACGMPEENLEYILGALELIADRGPESNKPFDKYSEWSLWWIQHKKDTIAHHGSEKAAYFFYYWADNQKLTEHGGSVPGRLTAKGEEVLKLLKEWKKNIAIAELLDF